MADIVEITTEERELIEPHLKEHLDEDSWQYIEDIFDYGVIHTYPEGTHFITLYIPNFPCMQFSAETGEFAELTTWDYVENVDAQA